MHRYHLWKLLLTFFIEYITRCILSLSLYGLHVFIKNTCNLYTYFIFYL
jgi:hypothetical protein